MSCFELDDVSFSYGSQAVLQKVNLRLDEGEILGLFGHNGAGKTTTIKLILGLIQPADGTISVLDSAPGHAFVKQRVGYLPENVSFYPEMTGFETLNYFSRLKRQAVSDVPELLAQVGLKDAMTQRVRTYSKGMRQRLGIAQALLGKPRLLILDEPTVGLDPVATADLYLLLQRLADTGTGIVLCSHVLPGVEPYIDQAAILNQGVLMASGNLQALRSAAHLSSRLLVTIASDQETLTHMLNLTPANALSPGPNPNQFVLHLADKEKLSILRSVLQLDGLVDLQLHDPSLEDLYRHFVSHETTTTPGIV